MTQSYVYDGSPLTRIRHSQVTLTQQAELMAVGIGRFVYNDTPGTMAIVGQKDFHAEQDDCPQPLIGRWFIGDQGYKRGLERVGASREIEVQIEDLNSIGGFYSFNGTSEFSGDRPAETVNDRMQWLDDDGWLPGVFFGTRVHSSTVMMDAANYGDQSPTDVVAACALAAGGWNGYIRVFDDYVGPELVFRNDNTSTDDTSSIVISNRPGDQDYDTVFPPLRDFELSKRPGRVASRIHFSWADGKVIEEDTDTADAFNGRRDITASDSNIKSAATASLRAKDLLHQHSTEERVIEGSILLPPEKVNLLAHGDRVGVRLEHMAPEGFYHASELRYCRVLETQIQPKLKPTRLYEVRLKLSPQEPADIPGDCTDIYPGTPTGDYWPLGGVNGPGAHPFNSDGVVYYWRGGWPAPLVPDTSYVGSWHFGLWGTGGEGTIDWAGTCSGNVLILMAVGNGTWSIQTKAYFEGARPLRVAKGPEFSDTTPLIEITSGDAIEVEIDDATDGDCIRVVTIVDPGGPGLCGSKWGFGGAHWEAA